MGPLAAAAGGMAPGVSVATAVAVAASAADFASAPSASCTEVFAAALSPPSRVADIAACAAKAGGSAASRRFGHPSKLFSRSHSYNRSSRDTSGCSITGCPGRAPGQARRRNVILRQKSTDGTSATPYCTALHALPSIGCQEGCASTMRGGFAARPAAGATTASAGAAFGGGGGAAAASAAGSSGGAAADVDGGDGGGGGAATAAAAAAAAAGVGVGTEGGMAEPGVPLRDEGGMSTGSSGREPETDSPSVVKVQRRRRRRKGMEDDEGGSGSESSGDGGSGRVGGGDDVGDDVDVTAGAEAQEVGDGVDGITLSRESTRRRKRRVAGLENDHENDGDLLGESGSESDSGSSTSNNSGRGGSEGRSSGETAAEEVAGGGDAMQDAPTGRRRTGRRRRATGLDTGIRSESESDSESADRSGSTRNDVGGGGGARGAGAGCVNENANLVLSAIEPTGGGESLTGESMHRNGAGEGGDAAEVVHPMSLSSATDGGGPKVGRQRRPNRLARATDSGNESESEVESESEGKAEAGTEIEGQPKSTSRAAAEDAAAATTMRDNAELTSTSTAAALAVAATTVTQVIAPVAAADAAANEPSPSSATEATAAEITLVEVGDEGSSLAIAETPSQPPPPSLTLSPLMRARRTLLEGLRRARAHGTGAGAWRAMDSCWEKMGGSRGGSGGGGGGGGGSAGAVAIEALLSVVVDLDGKQETRMLNQLLDWVVHGRRVRLPSAAAFNLLLCAAARAAGHNFTEAAEPQRESTNRSEVESTPAASAAAPAGVVAAAAAAAAAAARRVELIFREMRQQGVLPSEETFEILMSAYARAGLHDRVAAAYRLLMSSGLSPSAEARRMLLVALCAQGQADAAEEVLVELEAAGELYVVDVADVNNLLFLYARAARPDDVRRVLLRFLTAGATTRSTRSNSSSSTFSSSGISVTELPLNERGSTITASSAPHDNACAPGTPAALSDADVDTDIDADADAPNGELMESPGVEKVVAAAQACEGAAEYHPGAAQLHSGGGSSGGSSSDDEDSNSSSSSGSSSSVLASNPFTSVHSLRANAASLRALLRALTLTGRHAEACEVVKMMQRLKVEPDPKLLTEVVAAFAEAGKPAEAEAFVLWLQGAGHLPLTQPSRQQQQQQQPTSATAAWPSAGAPRRRKDVDVWVRKSEEEEEAQSVSRKFAPTFISLVYAYAKQRLWGEAEEVISDMWSLFGPSGMDERAYTVLMGELARSGDADRAAEVLDGMASRGIVARAASFRAVVKAYCTARRPERAEAMLLSMHTKGWKVPDDCAVAVIGAYAQCRKLRDVERVVAQVLPELGFPPPPTSTPAVRAAVVACYALLGMPRTAERTFMEGFGTLPAAGTRVRGRSSNTLAASQSSPSSPSLMSPSSPMALACLWLWLAYGVAGIAEDAERVRVGMALQGVAVSWADYNAVLRSYILADQWREAEWMARQMRAGGIRISDDVAARLAAVKKRGGLRSSVLSVLQHA